MRGAQKPRILGVLALIGVTFLGTGSTRARAGEEGSKVRAERLDAYLRSCEAFGWSGSVLVARDGRVLLRAGYGMAHRGEGRRNDVDTLFEIASVTKVFTACAVMKLVETGRVALDDPIARHLPGVPEDKRDITVRHLLTHTSGMGRMVGGGGSDVRAAVSSYLGKPRTRKAGEAFEYWNGGYALLAALIEQVSGGSYMQFCVEHLFHPAGMSSTGFTGDARLPKERQAVGYDGEHPVRAAADHPYRDYDFGYKGMGGVVTSAADLWRFARALWEGRVLKPAGVRLMQQRVVQHQGLGWGVLDSGRGTTRLVHGGDVRGFHTAYELLPDERGAVIVLSNVEGVPPWKIQWNLQAMLFDEPTRYAVPPLVADRPAEELEALVGVYRAKEAASSLVVEHAGHVLQVGAEGAAAVEALSTSADTTALEARIAKARALLDAIVAKDVEAIEATLPEGAFYAKTWPPILVNTIWPEQVEAWGALRGVRAIGATRLERGMVQVVLGLRHARGDRRMQAIYLADGRLSRLTFDGPRFALRRVFAPTHAGTFRSFDWNQDDALPEITFEHGPNGRLVLVVRRAESEVARFRRE